MVLPFLLAIFCCLIFCPCFSFSSSFGVAFCFSSQIEANTAYAHAHKEICIFTFFMLQPSFKLFLRCLDQFSKMFDIKIGQLFGEKFYFMMTTLFSPGWQNTVKNRKHHTTFLKSFFSPGHSLFHDDNKKEKKKIQLYKNGNIMPLYLL